MEALVARIVQMFLALSGAYAIALWFALIVWTYRDITTRSENAATQIFSTLVVVLFWVPGAVIYLLLRPKETLEEAFQRSVEEEYLLQDLDDVHTCPNCNRSIRDDFIFCPHCRAVLRTECPSCRKPVDVRWEICPYCAFDLVEPTSDDEDEQQQTSRFRGVGASGSLQAIDGFRSSGSASRPVATTTVTQHGPSIAEASAGDVNPRGARGQGSAPRQAESDS